MKRTSFAIAAGTLAAAITASASITLVGNDLSTIPLSTPGAGATATYSAGQITLTSPDNVGGSGFNEFNDTALLTINNGFKGVSLGTLNQFLGSGASFNLKSMTGTGAFFAYWNVTINNGVNSFVINSFDDGKIGANPFNVGLGTSASVGYSIPGNVNMGFAFGTPWLTLASTYGTYNVSSVSIDVGGWNTGVTEIAVIDSITLPGSQVPEAPTVIAGGLLLLPFGVTLLRRLRRNRMA